MRIENNIRRVLLTVVATVMGINAWAQHDSDSLAIVETGDSIGTLMVPITEPEQSVMVDSIKIKKVKRNWDTWKPNPQRALWLALVLPGAGQIYNRKYWKLPLVYGGFLGCIYALNWNNTMYRDYSQAYIDIMDSDENTNSYENFIPAKYNVQANKNRLQELFRRKKNYYRRYRDLSMFCMIGVYALSIIDAYVDAELSSFDISKDLSMKVRPAVIHDRLPAFRSPGMNGSSYGLQCSLNF